MPDEQEVIGILEALVGHMHSREQKIEPVKINGSAMSKTI